MVVNQLGDHVRTLSAAELDRSRSALMGDGFCVIADAVDGDAIARLTEEINSRVESARAGVGSGTDEWHFDASGGLIGVANLDRYSDLAFDLARAAPLIAIVEGLLDSPCVPLTTELFSKPANSTAVTPAHQDQDFYRAYFTDEVGLTLWCPLMDIGPDDAPLEYAVPNVGVGQFLQHSAASELVDADRFNFRPVLVGAGDLLGHHAYSVHRSAPNRGGRDRLAIGFSYRTSASPAGGGAT